MSVRVVTEEELRAAVEAVPDPELPVLSLADLGVLREVSIEETADGPRGLVRLTPTYLACPALGTIKDDVRAAVAGLGLDARVEVVLSPPWHPGLISERGRVRLAEAGIVPPLGGATTGPVDLGIPGVVCPRCGGASRLVSGRGPTPCTSLHVCLGCGEPFEKVRER